MSRDISVVLCTYNGADYLREFLASLDRQSDQASELIVHDDGSTDETLELIRAYGAALQQRGARFILLVNKSAPRGASRSFALAAERATCEFVAFADQDDVWEEDRLSSGVDALISSGGSLSGSDALLTDVQGRSLGATVFDQFESRLMPRDAMLNNPLSCLRRQNYIPGMTMTARRSALKGWLPVPEDWLHDYWFAVQAAGSDGLQVLPAPKVRYRQHSANVLGVQRQLSPRRLAAALSRRLTGVQQSRPRTADWSNVEGRLSAQFTSKLRFEEQRERLNMERSFRRTLSIVRLLPQYREFSHLGRIGALRDWLN